jgi:hypothetical protein
MFAAARSEWQTGRPAAKRREGVEARSCDDHLKGESMVGGQDKGFAFSYWGLSYRRKFIRTIWSSILGAAVCVALLIQFPEFNGWSWYALIISIPLAVLQAAYNYRRWQAELSSNRASQDLQSA